MPKLFMYFPSSDVFYICRYGPLFIIKLGAARVLVINNWELAKECYTKNDVVVSYRPNLLFGEHMTYNQAMFGFAPYGPYWREMRKIVTSGLLSNHRMDLQSHFRVTEVRTSIKELFNFWSRRKDNSSNFMLVNLSQWFHELAFNTALRIAAGKRYFGEIGVNEEEANRCLKALREFMRLVGVFTVADAIPYLKWFDFGGHEKAMRRVFEELDSVATDWLQEHRQKRALAKDVESDQDFIDVMLSTLDGTTIEGFDSDTVIKATTLVSVYY